MKYAVWAKNKSKEMNVALAFLYDIGTKSGDEIKVRVTACNVYKMFVSDQLLGYGPARAAHGYARIDEYVFIAKGETEITFEVVGYRVNGYAYLNENPFFACEVFVNGKLYTTAKDATCYELTDRIKKVQRYSFQRPFIEVYKSDTCRTALYRREKNVFPRIELEEVVGRIYCERGVKYPELSDTNAFEEIERGMVWTDKDKPVYRNREITDIGEQLLGFQLNEIEDMVSDTVCRFVYEPNNKEGNKYILYDAGREYSGMIKVKVRVIKPCEIYFLFDEILWNEEENLYSNGEKNLNFLRFECCNVVKYTLKQGEYLLQSFEPYSFRYVKAVCIGGNAEILWVKAIKTENPAEQTFKGKIADAESDAILQAAFRTFKQNSLDILMDCPSRERAGWTNDSYFSSKADLLFSGRAVTEKNHLENVLWASELPQLPRGMIPMCYPSDHSDGQFIPQCTMWFLMEACERLARFPNESLKENVKTKAYAALKYFQDFENADGLLENLRGWVFLEHSICNSRDYVAGVNYPSNMIYYGMLKKVGETFDDNELKKKAEKLKNKILDQSFNGELFEDNRIRENNTLVLKGHLSETCQYYAFFFEIADEKTYPKLYKRLFLEERTTMIAKYPSLPQSNVIVGLLMRLEILKRYGLKMLMVAECKDIFLKMAKRTSTLWEHNGISASCNHGITSIAAVWLVNAYTGYRDVQNGRLILDDDFLGADCDFVFYYDNVPIHIRVEKGKRIIESKYFVAH